MSAKVDTTNVEAQRAAAASPSTSSATGTKTSMFKGKAGFVIPKNKFSGSLVPIFKGAKKTESNDAAIDETNRQLHRKTKWSPDLTQDTSVRRGRALAYQTRVDQITQLLKSGSLGSESQDSKSARDAPDGELPTMQIEFKKLQSLELERREAIGEILKLNPNYKAPSDYQPVVREATVPIPVKAHPDYNFLGLVYGTDGEIQKRLEKETGTKIQVCGTKPETKETVEITASDGSDLITSCEEVYIRITSDTYEKADAAASLIELLLSTVPVKSTASTTTDSVTGDKDNGGQDILTTHGISAAVANQELQSGAGSIPTSSQGPFQPYPSSWLPAGQYSSPSGLAPVPNSMAFQFNPSLPRPLFGPGHPAPYGFGSSHQSSAVPSPRLHTSTQIMPGTYMPPAYSVGQTGPPRNLSASASPFSTSSPLVGHQPTLAGSSRHLPPQLAEGGMTPPSTSSGWAMPPASAPQSLLSGSFPTMGSQMRSSSPMPSQGVALSPQTQLFHPSSNNALRPMQNSLPSSSAPHAPSFTPLKHMGQTAPGLTLPGSSGFTFQPQRPHVAPSQSLPGPGLQFSSQRPTSAPLPPAPQGPSFRPALQNAMQHPVRQNFPGPPFGNQMGPRPGHFGPPNPNQHMGPRHLGPVPQAPNAGGPYPPRVGHPAQYQQSYPAPSLSRPGGNFPANMRPSPSGRPQVYDPFSPTSISAPRPQGNNNGVARKQDSDPEYEDLMASVGVK
ncbi:branchpoint-bridging protein-like isoform X1 [Chenopodium quinoa]|uniref:branchpoint-bridging protein-like isoform X1 n=2 Tax=Chenopodium quinoa TaxID=63459 RepID=UPI000B77F052|nr:branchpoint-bridging protein-like isoform X1 [Chenopodium quinoa]